MKKITDSPIKMNAYGSTGLKYRMYLSVHVAEYEQSTMYHVTSLSPIYNMYI